MLPGGRSVGIPGWPRRKQEGSLQEGVVADLGLGFPRSSWDWTFVEELVEELEDFVLSKCMCVRRV